MGLVRVGKIDDPVLTRPWYVEDLNKPSGEQWSFHGSWQNAIATAAVDMLARREAAPLAFGEAVL